MAIFHVKHPTPKHVENSLRGIRKAARARKRKGARLVRRYTEIDLDLQITKDGRIVNTHWSRPMRHDGFRDPKGKIPPGRMVSQMTLAEVQRLRAGRWPRVYRIPTVEAALRQCARSGIGARLEPKGDRRFENVDLWWHVKAYADRAGAKVRGYSIRNLGGKGAGVRRVAAMEKAGIPSKVIH